MASLFKKKKIPNLTEDQFLDFVKRIKAIDDRIIVDSNLKRHMSTLRKLKKALEVK